jgi:hypothetical protein
VSLELAGNAVRLNGGPWLSLDDPAKLRDALAGKAGGATEAVLRGEETTSMASVGEALVALQSVTLQQTRFEAPGLPPVTVRAQVPDAWKVVVTVGSDGFHFASSKEEIPDVPPGIPLRGGQFDYPALEQALVQLKQSAPQATAATVATAVKGVDLGVFLRTGALVSRSFPTLVLGFFDDTAVLKFAD